MTTATRTDEILAQALELVESVPYRVSLRWVFYELYQRGVYAELGTPSQKKAAYKAFKALCARARKSFRDGWHPDTLADDTRARIGRTFGYDSIETALSLLITDTVSGFRLDVDHFYQQEHYLEIWFEAKAMAGQFEHYTQRVDLVPFGGDPSIPLKWALAQNLDECEKYGLPIVVLYFGDYDPKGLQIAESAVFDIRQWCSVDFELVRCGLNLDQIEEYNVPQNPSKPGEYQWEALSDPAAREIITASMSEYMDLSLVDTVIEEERDKEVFWKQKIEASLKRLVKKHRGD